MAIGTVQRRTKIILMLSSTLQKKPGLVSSTNLPYTMQRTHAVCRLKAIHQKAVVAFPKSILPLLSV